MRACHVFAPQHASVLVWQHLAGRLYSCYLCGVYCVQRQREPFLHCHTYARVNSCGYGSPFLKIEPFNILLCSITSGISSISSLHRCIPVSQWDTDSASLSVYRWLAHFCHGLWGHLLPFHSLLYVCPGEHGIFHEVGYQLFVLIVVSKDCRTFHSRIFVSICNAIALSLL